MKRKPKQIQQQVKLDTSQLVLQSAPIVDIYLRKNSETFVAIFDQLECAAIPDMTIVNGSCVVNRTFETINELKEMGLQNLQILDVSKMKGLILFLDDYNQVAGQLNAHTTNCYNGNQIVVLYENPDLLKEDFFRIKRANIQLATTRKYSFMKLQQTYKYSVHGTENISADYWQRSRRTFYYTEQSDMDRDQLLIQRTQQQLEIRVPKAVYELPPRQGIVFNLSQVTEFGNFVFVDFEAAQIFDSQVVLSEIGAVRVVDQQVVAYFHAFYDQALQAQQSRIKLVRSQADGAARITDIPNWEMPSYQQFSTDQQLFDHQLIFDQFIEFCSRSSAQLQDNKFAAILKQFDESPATLIAKGVELEMLMLNNHQKFFTKVFEVDEIVGHVRKSGVLELPKQLLHGKHKKTFQFCDFHKQNLTLMMTSAGAQYHHCGLDDSWTLAQLFINFLQGITDNIEEVEDPKVAGDTEI